MVAEAPAAPETTPFDDDIRLREVALRAHDARMNRLRGAMEAIAEQVRWEEEQVQPVRQQLRDLMKQKLALDVAP